MTANFDYHVQNIKNILLISKHNQVLWECWQCWLTSLLDIFIKIFLISNIPDIAKVEIFAWHWSDPFSVSGWPWGPVTISRVKLIKWPRRFAEDNDVTLSELWPARRTKCWCWSDQKKEKREERRDLFWSISQSCRFLSMRGSGLASCYFWDNEEMKVRKM